MISPAVSILPVTAFAGRTAFRAPAFSLPSRLLSTRQSLSERDVQSKASVIASSPCPQYSKDRDHGQPEILSKSDTSGISDD